ncbi:superoxide dismutase [Candidatus Woesebacteria bacterium]|nr:superoxide dismutase [Candidatus Woesebacteria bacterium]
MFTLPALPYEYGALEPYFDAKTMEIHHTKHHQTYVDKLNATLQTQREVSTSTIEELLKGISSVPEQIRMAVRNHAGGHSNHTLFWQSLSPQGGSEPKGALAELIVRDFGTYTAFKDVFTAAAQNHFGSGWAWLVQQRNGVLRVYSTSNQDSPYMTGDTPVLGLDLWEHAYYLKYQNKRPDYIQAFWPIVNWKIVSERIV